MDVAGVLRVLAQGSAAARRPECYIRAETLTATNTVLVEAQAAVELAQVWGRGLVASIDGMRFVVPVRTHHAGPNRKFFARKAGSTWLNVLNEQSAGWLPRSSPARLGIRSTWSTW
nr:Tn3 family transposase [Nocardia beijingensis]